MRIFWLFNHPARYKVDLFNLLGVECQLDAYFERESEKGRNASFYQSKATYFTPRFCKGIKWGEANSYSSTPIKALKENEYDIVIINGWSTLTEMKAIRYLKRHHIPYIFYINGGIPKLKESPIRRHLKRKYLSGAAAYLAPDDASKQYLTFYGVDPSLIEIYPYSSISEKEMPQHLPNKQEKQEAKKKWNIDGEKAYVASGFFNRRKNFSQLISIWSKMPEDYHLYLVGEGELKDEYETQIASLKLDNVHLHPFLDHPSLFSFYQGCDAFCLLSKEDIYGHVINEAMGQGLPVVASDRMNSAKHLIKDGVNGYLVPIDDEEFIVKSLINAVSLNGEESLKKAKENTLEASAKWHLEYFKGYLKK